MRGVIVIPLAFPVACFQSCRAAEPADTHTRHQKNGFGESRFWTTRLRIAKSNFFVPLSYGQVAQPRAVIGRFLGHAQYVDRFAVLGIKDR